MSKNNPIIVLASSSAPRKALMERLQLPFVSCSPNIDESCLQGESTKDLVLRLAREKAQAVAYDYPDALIIGCDQTAELEGQQLNKPHHFDAAVKQLMSMSGKKVQFITGLCLLNTRSNHIQQHLETTDTYFRSFTQAQAENYLHKDQPYQCCGSLKSEGLGITLVEKIISNDPTALIGMSLIALVTMLQNEGVEII
jgi:septum formation protein